MLAYGYTFKRKNNYCNLFVFPTFLTVKKIDIRKVDVIQYLQPLREGGSLPALVKASDDFLYVVKFRGAGQGKKALIAEFIGGELARAMGLNVPEMVFIHLDDSFSKTEPDEEIQDLLKFSGGLNLGLHFLSGAITYDPLVSKIDSGTASKVVLLDALIMNIDRTVKNTNLLKWNRELWLIDHGASLYFHHNWKTWKAYLNGHFPKINEHVLLSSADNLDQAAESIKNKISENTILDIISNVPDEWMNEESNGLTPEEIKKAYIEFLNYRLEHLESLVKDAKDAR